MKIARIRAEGQTGYAIVEDKGFRLIEGDIFGSWKETDRTVSTEAAELLSPVDPPQVLAIGLNYRKHATESGFPIPELPLLFVKTFNTVTGPGSAIVLPAMAPNEVDYEAELVLVIGKTAKNVSRETASDYILGYTCGNDVSARDCQLRVEYFHGLMQLFRDQFVMDNNIDILGFQPNSCFVFFPDYEFGPIYVLGLIHSATSKTASLVEFSPHFVWLFSLRRKNPDMNASHTVIGLDGLFQGVSWCR